MARTRKIVVLIAALFSLSASVWAGPIYKTNIGIELNGTRSETNPAGPGIITQGTYVNDGKVQSLVWSITAPGAGSNIWSYSYTFLNFGRPEISHILLQLSLGCGEDPLCVTNIKAYEGTPPTAIKTTPYEINNFYVGDPAHPGLPANIYGIKLDFGGESPFTVSFNSNRDPVWGNFYSKGGSNANNLGIAYNSGLLYENRNSENPFDFIARPNGGHAMAIPGTAGLLLAGIALAFVLRRRNEIV